jgi:hypothetical protein
MLIGIEFKRRKVHLEDEGRTVWFWRVAPYVRDADPVKVGAFFVFTLGMTALVLLGRVIEAQ